MHLLRMHLIALTILVALCGTPALALPWPAEPLSSAVNLTAVEGAGANDFYNDLSGAFWNPVTRRLWVCRNGPGGSNSKFWALAEDGAGGFVVDERLGNRGEWTGFGDLEGIAQADYNEDVVYLIIEGEERIKEYDISVYGAAILNRTWDTRSYLPLNGGSGAEGITFVPDEHLLAADFVDQNGNPYTSQNGMGGLMFVAHQNGGRIYVFDLDRSDGSFTFVGKYKTNYSESCSLEFDRSSGLLYIFHGNGRNSVEVTDLTSVASGDERQFVSLYTYDAVASGNLEGMAVQESDDCNAGDRGFFLTIDDGGANALFWFQQFPCQPDCITDSDCDDGLYCNGAESCNAASCVAGTPPCTGGLCDETADACVDCLDDADCSDDQFCNGIEQCVGGACQAGAAPCGGGLCDDATDSCVECIDAGDCDDDNPCNGSEVCDAGVCVPGTSVDCSALDSDCLAGVCDPDTGACVTTPANAGGDCDDGLDCTTGDACVAGECVGSPACDSGEYCSGASGACVTPTATDVLPIAVGADWRYFKGTQAPGSDWINVVFDDSTWPTGPSGFGYDTGADYAPFIGTTLADMPGAYRSVYSRYLFQVDEPARVLQLTLTIWYDDGFVAYLNGQEVVRANLAGTAPAHNVFASGNHEATAAGESFTIDLSLHPLADGVNVLALQVHNINDTSSDFVSLATLDAVFAECLTDGECNDGVFCNGAEQCISGYCANGADPCPDDLCDESKDVCVTCLDDADCADGLFCNGDEVCVAGACHAGSARCPGSFCDESADACVGCLVNADCDDGGFCNGAETCVAGACQPGSDPCAGEQCNEVSDACVECLQDADCNDGAFCNGAATCVAGACQPGSDPCVGRQCDEASDACVECLVDADCDDGAFCNGAEACVAGACEAGLNPCPGELCDPDSGACVECLLDATCDDQDLCTVDACVNGTCTFTPDVSDQDQDGVVDCADQCPGAADVDTDTDGVLDCLDGCPEDPGKLVPGTCGCGVPEGTCGSSGGGGGGSFGGGSSGGTTDSEPSCVVDADCDDGVFCNGLEPCMQGACLPGEAPCAEGYCDEDADTCLACLVDGECDDGDACTLDACIAGECVFAPDSADRDRDGVPDCRDGCPLDPTMTAPGQCGCGTPEGACSPNGDASDDGALLDPAELDGESGPIDPSEAEDPSDSDFDSEDNSSTQTGRVCGSGGGLAMVFTLLGLSGLERRR